MLLAATALPRITWLEVTVHFVRADGYFFFTLIKACLCGTVLDIQGRYWYNENRKGDAAAKLSVSAPEWYF